MADGDGREKFEEALGTVVDAEESADEEDDDEEAGATDDDDDGATDDGAEEDDGGALLALLTLLLLLSCAVTPAVIATAAMASPTIESENLPLAKSIIVREDGRRMNERMANGWMDGLNERRLIGQASIAVLCEALSRPLVPPQ